MTTNNAISETELRLRVLSTNKALSSTLLLLQSQNKALQSQNRALSFAISRMESRLKKKKRRMTTDDFVPRKRLEDMSREERVRRAERVLERYNHYYNTECSALPWGTPITPEFQQAMTLECMIDALRCENLNHEFDVVPVEDITDLIQSLYQQGKEFLERPYRIVPND